MNKRQYKKWWKYHSLESSTGITTLTDIMRRWRWVRYSPRTVRLIKRRKRTWLGGKGRKGKHKQKTPSYLIFDEWAFSCPQTDKELPFVEVK